MRSRLLLACVALGSCLLAASASGRPYAPWPDFDALAARYPGAAAVCLLDEREASLRDLGGDKYGKHETVTRSFAILDPARAAEWLDLSIPNSPQSKVVRLSARTWTGPNASIEVKGADVHDVASFADYVLFSDVRAKRFAFPAAAARTVVEYRYERESTSGYTLAHMFARGVPTLRSRAILDVPERWLAEGFREVIRAKDVSATPAEDMTRDSDGDVRRLIWEMTDLPALRDEPQMPAWSDIAPRVDVLPLPFDGSAWDWDRLGGIYWKELFAPRLGREPEIQALAQQLAAGAATPAERCARAARFVARDVRYVAVEMGIGGYQPHRASEVLRNRYGDCKDKVCLLLSLLSAMGIAGDPVLVRTAGEGMLDPELVDLGQFDHMIARVRVGDDALWIDPTATGCRPGELPWADQSTQVLVVAAQGSHLETTPVARAEDNELCTTLDAALSPTGDLAGWLTLEGMGAAAAAQRAEFRAREPAEARRLAAALLEDRLPGAQLLEFAVSDPDSVEAPFRLRARFARPGGALVVDRSLVLLPQVFAVDRAPEGFADSSRTWAVELGYLQRYRDRVHVVPPPGFVAEAPATPTRYEGEFFSFGLAPAAQAGAFDLESTLSGRALTVGPGEFRAARGELARFRSAQGALAVRFRPSR